MAPEPNRVALAHDTPIAVAAGRRILSDVVYADGLDGSRMAAWLEPSVVNSDVQLVVDPLRVGDLQRRGPNGGLIFSGSGPPKQALALVGNHVIVGGMANGGLRSYRVTDLNQPACTFSIPGELTNPSVVAVAGNRNLVAAVVLSDLLHPELVTFDPTCGSTTALSRAELTDAPSDVAIFASENGFLAVGSLGTYAAFTQTVAGGQNPRVRLSVPVGTVSIALDPEFSVSAAGVITDGAAVAVVQVNAMVREVVRLSLVDATTEPTSVTVASEVHTLMTANRVTAPDGCPYTLVSRDLAGVLTTSLHPVGPCGNPWTLRVPGPWSFATLAADGSVVVAVDGGEVVMTPGVFKDLSGNLQVVEPVVSGGIDSAVNNPTGHALTVNWAGTHAVLLGDNHTLVAVDPNATVERVLGTSVVMHAVGWSPEEGDVVVAVAEVDGSYELRAHFATGSAAPLPLGSGLPEAITVVNGVGTQPAYAVLVFPGGALGLFSVSSATGLLADARFGSATATGQVVGMVGVPAPDGTCGFPQLFLAYKQVSASAGCTASVIGGQAAVEAGSPLTLSALCGTDAVERLVPAGRGRYFTLRNDGGGSEPSDDVVRMDERLLAGGVSADFSPVSGGLTAAAPLVLMTNIDVPRVAVVSTSNGVWVTATTNNSAMSTRQRVTLPVTGAPIALGLQDGSGGLELMAYFKDPGLGKLVRQRLLKVP